MIDFEDMKQKQEMGKKDIDSLVGDEKTVLKHYCSLATEALLRLGLKSSHPVDEIVVNALRLGIALGLHLEITAGEVRGR